MITPAIKTIKTDELAGVVSIELTDGNKIAYTCALDGIANESGITRDAKVELVTPDSFMYDAY